MIALSHLRNRHLAFILLFIALKSAECSTSKTIPEHLRYWVEPIRAYASWKAQTGSASVWGRLEVDFNNPSDLSVLDSLAEQMHHLDPDRELGQKLLEGQLLNREEGQEAVDRFFDEALKLAQPQEERRLSRTVKSYLQKKPARTIGDLVKQYREGESLYRELVFAQYLFNSEAILELTENLHNRHPAFVEAFKEAWKQTLIGSGSWPGGLDILPVPEEPAVLAEVIKRHNHLNRSIRSYPWQKWHEAIRDVKLTLNTETDPMNPSFYLDVQVDPKFFPRQEASRLRDMIKSTTPEFGNVPVRIMAHPKLSGRWLADSALYHPNNMQPDLSAGRIHLIDLFAINFLSDIEADHKRMLRAALVENPDELVRILLAKNILTDASLVRPRPILDRIIIDVENDWTSNNGRHYFTTIYDPPSESIVDLELIMQPDGSYRINTLPVQ